MAGLMTLLDDSHVLCRSTAQSQKNIFELVARGIAATHEELDEQLLFKKFLAREKLGSTGLGEGVAVPHSRIEGLEYPIGYLLTLAEPAPYDAPDNQGVDILFALLVPEESTQLHLDLLSEIATLLSDNAYCERLRKASDRSELLALATHSRVA